MYRMTVALLTGIICCVEVSPVRCQETPFPEEALKIEQAMQKVIRDAEPSVVCILVSRSDAYRKLFRDQPPTESPGKLGGFHSNTAAQQPGSLPRVQKSSRPDDPSKKYDLASPDYVPEAFGSGVVIDGKELLVLTCYHVVQDATKIYVRLLTDKGSYADILAADPRSDLAVLRLLNEELRPLSEIKFGDGDAVQKGQLVLSLANTFAAGFRDQSAGASWGIVSNIRRSAARGPGEERSRALYHGRTLVQTDARLHQGCSGGVLLNLKGEAIALTTSRAAVAGSEFAGGFAVPLDAAMKRIIERLRNGLEIEYGFLGVQCERDAGRDEGLWIQRVVSGSPAEKAGLRVGDRILSINGVHLREEDELYLNVALLPAGSETSIEVANRSPAIRATLAKHHVPGKTIVSKKPPAVRGIRVDFSSVLWMQNETGMRFRGRDIQPGVYVNEVEPGSPAAAARLQANDIITHVNGQSVDSPAEFYKEAAKTASSTPLELTLFSQDWGQNYRSTKLVIR